MDGFEVLAAVAAYNAAYAFDDYGQPLREGIPLELWRALPDSPA
jgi:hypothetical protein